MARPTKYTEKMSQKTYEVLANGGTIAEVCNKLGIDKTTFYEWSGKGKYKNSPYVKSEFSYHIKRGELAGEAWLDEELRKAAFGLGTTKRNPTLLIFMTKRRDFILRLIPELKDGTTIQKLKAITGLYCDKMICLDTYG